MPSLVGKRIKAKRAKPPTHSLQKRFLSPFRYPGGKSWFVKIARKWLEQQSPRPALLAEPFAGGAGISLAAIKENLVDRAAFAELDRDVADTWSTILNGRAQWLANAITSFRFNRKNVEALLARKAKVRRQRAFQCLVRNRVARGGVLTKGAGLIRKGERGNGLRSRWYPATLATRIREISALKDRLTFTKEDGFKLIQRSLDQDNVVFFVDPPYTKAACRLYKHWKIDHERLFALLSRAKGKVLMTYDDTAEIRQLATSYGFKYRRILMKTTHHARKRELMIAKDFSWTEQQKGKRQT